MILERKSGFNLSQVTHDVEEALVFPLGTDDRLALFKDVLSLQNLYNAAINEVSTKLEILDDEFQMLYTHNPIHHLESRLKSPQSIMDKLARRGLPRTAQAARENLNDIAVIRVICNYQDDIYRVADLLTQQDDIELVKTTDYIKNPKANGYRSLHLVVTVPVFLADGRQITAVEIQLRTIAMDFWASLEHQLHYKSQNNTPVQDDARLQAELKNCADGIALIDTKMQEIYNTLNSLDR